MYVITCTLIVKMFFRTIIHTAAGVDRFLITYVFQTKRLNANYSLYSFQIFFPKKNMTTRPEVKPFLCANFTDLYKSKWKFSDCGQFFFFYLRFPKILHISETGARAQLRHCRLYPRAYGDRFSCQNMTIAIRSSPLDCNNIPTYSVFSFGAKGGGGRRRDPYTHTHTRTATMTRSPQNRRSWEEKNVNNFLELYTLYMRWWDYIIPRSPGAARNVLGSLASKTVTSTASPVVYHFSAVALKGTYTPAKKK